MPEATLYPRFAEAGVLEALTDSPVVLLHGPRQCGKTTLAKLVGASQGYSYITFDDDVARAAAENDPAGFVDRLPPRVILDEVQVMPELFSALRPEIDAHRKPGRFLLLGSASGKLLNQSSESLAGRVSYLELAPFLLAEIGPEADAWKKLWLRGGFPSSFTAPPIGCRPCGAPIS